MSIDYTVGDEVVCINVTTNENDPDNLLGYIKLNDVYTVEFMFPFPYDHNQIAVTLVGVRHSNGRPIAYQSYRFRKVQKKFSGMEKLRGLLNVREKEDA